MFKEFEPARNDQQRTERLWPASTGWLIVSILFANKLWVMDATSMSLYWVARLPIERPKASSPLAPLAARRSAERSTVVAPTASRNHPRQWKIALSIAIVGALAAPFAFRTFNARPTYSVWVPLTAQERADLALSLRNQNYCGGKRIVSDSDFVVNFGCQRNKERFELGGDYERHPDWLKYWLSNAVAVAATFAAIFGLAYLIPALVRGFAFSMRRYWKWLKS